MRIEQLRETGPARPALASGEYSGETRASITGRLLDAYRRELHERLHPTPRFYEVDFAAIERRIFLAYARRRVVLRRVVRSGLAFLNIVWGSQAMGATPQEIAADTLRPNQYHYVAPLPDGPRVVIVNSSSTEGPFGPINLSPIRRGSVGCCDVYRWRIPRDSFRGVPAADRFPSTPARPTRPVNR